MVSSNTMASSLEILRPAPSPQTPYSATTSSIAEELEIRSLGIARSDSTSFLTCDFEPTGVYQGEILRVNADVDEERGKAKVWLLLSARQESVLIFSWRKEGESWRCYRLVGIGFEGFRI